jgi:3-hydroxymyristoyl/3-hydroxydecanoyl-(acyl carrier protein) dehydratase
MSALLYSEDIMKVIPHRYPFLFVDSIVEYKLEKELTASIYFNLNNDIFKGHFKDYPIVPGVILIEASAQTSILFLELNSMNWQMGNKIKDLSKSKEFWVLSKTKTTFQNLAFPPIQIFISVNLEWIYGNSAELNVKAYCQGNIFMTGSLICSKIRKIS